MTDPLFTPLKSHPSTWQAEVAQIKVKLVEAESAVEWADVRATQAVEEARELRAENTRLRDALQLYENKVQEYASDDWTRSDHAYDWLHEDAGKTARAALQEGKG